MSLGIGLNEAALRRLRGNPWAMASSGVITFYCAIALLTRLGWLASPWNTEVGPQYQAPSAESFALWLGTDFFGHSVLYQVLHGCQVAISVGLISCLISIPLGMVLGALAGYFGGRVDEAVVWLYSTLESVPNIMLLTAITFVLGRGLSSVYLALGATAWVGLCRVIRGEFLKHRNRDYVVAAESIGASHFSRMVKHIFPNVSHFLILDLSMQFMGAIKAEVILTFLGLGVRTGQPSWGVMIDNARQEVVHGVWWGLAGAAGGMFFIVLALNLFGDAVRDALDPKTQ